MAAPVLATAARMVPALGAGAVALPSAPVILAGAAAVGFVVWMVSQTGYTPFYKSADGSEIGIRKVA